MISQSMSQNMSEEEKKATPAPLLTIYDAESKRHQKQMVEEGLCMLRLKQKLAFDKFHSRGEKINFC